MNFSCTAFRAPPEVVITLEAPQRKERLQRDSRSCRAVAALNKEDLMPQENHHAFGRVHLDKSVAARGR